MQTRRLGRTDLSVAPLVLGGNVFGWTADKKTSFDVLDRFLAAGLNAIDTADVYSAWAPGNSGGESETIIGEWMKARGNRSRVIVITKVGSPMGKGKEGLKAHYIAEAVEASLKRLADGRDRPLSLALAGHGDAGRRDARRLPAPDRAGQDPLVRRVEPERQASRGRARSVKGEGIAAVRGSAAGIQSRRPQRVRRRPRRFCQREQIGVITYFSLAKGFLSGKYRSEADLSKSPRGDGVKAYLNPRGFRILDALEAVAASHKAKPAEVALAWIIARPGVTAPIASATSVEQTESLVRATGLALSKGDMDALNNASGP